MDPLVFEWAYDEEVQAIVVMTPTVVHTYFYTSRIDEKVELDVPLAPAVAPEAPLEQPLVP